MKRLIVMLFAMVAIIGTAVGADAFLGWNSTDIAGMEAAIKKSQEDVNLRYKFIYAAMIAMVSKPEAVDTFAKYDAYMKAEVEKYKWELTESYYFEKLIEVPYVRKMKIYTEDIQKDERSKNSYYFNVNYCLVKSKLFDLKFTDAEVKARIVEWLPKVFSKNDSVRAHGLSKRYIELTIADKNETVVDNLMLFYRCALPKLSIVGKEKAWNPTVVMLGLALQSRGVKVD